MSQTITLVLNTTAQGAGINATINGLRGVKDAAQDLDSWLKRVTSSAAGVLAGIVSIQAVTNAIKQAVTTGVKFNATIQDAQLGIAAILKQFNPQGFKTFDQAIGVAAEAIEELKKKAVESPASFRQLVQGFQAISGAATSAGIKLRDQVELTVLMSQALAGLGIRPEQLIQESRALITGNINEDAMAARILGITKAQINEAKEQGRLYDFLREKLAAFAEAGALAQGNLSTASSNLADVVEQKLGAVTVPIFEALTRAALRMTSALKDADMEGSLRRIAERMASVVDLATWLGTKGAEHINTIAAAVEVLAVAVGLLGVRIGIAIGATLVSRFAPLLTTASKLNVALLAIGSAFAGWKLGELVGEMEVLGATINEHVTDAILTALEAWEKLKLAMGFGNPSMLAGIQSSRNDILMEKLFGPRKPGTAGGAGTNVPPPDPKMASSAEALKLLLQQNEQRLSFIGQMDGSPAERTSARADALRERLTLLEKERKVIGELQVSVGEDGLPLVREDEIEKIKRLNELLYETGAIQAELDDTAEGFFRTMGEGLEKLTEQFDDLGASVAEVLLDGIASAIDTVADGLWRVVDGTATWGELFQNVGRQIVSGLIKIAIQELILDNLKKIIVTGWSAFQSAMRAKDVAEANATEAAKTPPLATNATLASISSYGVAAAIGIAAIAAVMASVGAFEKGGVIGGGEQLIRVNEAGTESILNAQATAMLGPETINALNAGEMPSGAPGTGAPGGSGSIQLILVDDMRSPAFLQALEGSAGRAKIVQIVRDAKVDIGIS